MKVHVNLLIVLLAAVFISGCAVENVEPFTNVGGTFEKKDTVLKDIPLPQDFTLIEGSFCHGTENFRYGEFLLQGQLSVNDLVFYYKKHMPARNWSQVNSMDRSANASMRFEKDDEYCTILCKEGQKSTELKIVVEQRKS